LGASGFTGTELPKLYPTNPLSPLGDTKDFSDASAGAILAKVLLEEI
jgi:hypothetical protein